MRRLNYPPPEYKSVEDGHWAKWQFISQGVSPAEHLFYIQLALDAGCKWVQLRLKESCDGDIIRTAIAVSELCAMYGARFILNDYVHLIKQCHADGVHLGLADQSVSAARQRLGGGYVIGGTANTIDDVLSRVGEGVDYIGLGPYKFTRTKKKLSPVLGLEGYQKILADRERCGVLCPVFAIGGIAAEDLPLLLRTAVDGIAISGWLTRQVDLSGWQQATGRKFTLDNVLEQYQCWKLRNQVAAHRVFEQVKTLEHMLHENNSKI